MNRPIETPEATAFTGTRSIASTQAIDTLASACTVIVNGQPHVLRDGARLSDLIDRLGHAPRSIATALNGEFVACADRPGCVLQTGDQVTCFQAIVGG